MRFTSRLGQILILYSPTVMHLYHLHSSEGTLQIVLGCQNSN